MNLDAKMAIPDSQRYHYLVYYVEVSNLKNVLIWLFLYVFCRHTLYTPGSADHCKLTIRSRSNTIDITATTLWLHCFSSYGFTHKCNKWKFNRLHIMNSKYFLFYQQLFYKRSSDKKHIRMLDVRLIDWWNFCFEIFFLSILMVIIVRTDEGQPWPKYIFNKCGTNIYFFYSAEVWSIKITEF